MLCTLVPTHGDIMRQPISNIHEWWYQPNCWWLLLYHSVYWNLPQSVLWKNSKIGHVYLSSRCVKTYEQAVQVYLNCLLWFLEINYQKTPWTMSSANYFELIVQFCIIHCSFHTDHFLWSKECIVQCTEQLWKLLASWMKAVVKN